MKPANPLLPWMTYLLRFAGVFNLLAGTGHDLPLSRGV